MGTVVGALAAGLVLAVGAGTAPAAQQAATEAVTEAAKSSEFEMAEVSTYSLGRYELLYGRRTDCMTAPDARVKAYPPLKSGKPLYGKAMLGMAPGQEFYFVIDESGGTGKGYDLLYLDLNRDLDLSNEKPLAVVDQPKPDIPPQGAGDFKSTWFEVLSIPWDFGPGIGVRPLELQTRLLTWQEGSSSLALIATKARRGRISVGSRTYQAVLGQIDPGLRYDLFCTALYLERVGGVGLNEPPEPYGDMLHEGLDQMRPVDGKWYSFTTTPTGDRLTVKEYQGDVGVLAVGKGSRKIDGPVGMTGRLYGGGHGVVVPVGNFSAPLSPADLKDPTKDYRLVERMTLPVGDYFPTPLTMRMGRLRLYISSNKYGPNVTVRQPPVRGIKIRKDQPFVLDFTNPPAVLLGSSGKDARLKPGEELSIQAVLIDPVLHVMIRRLEDVSRTVKQELWIGGGGSHTSEQPLSLAPTVVITNAAGKPVAEGVMPFG